jgi:hypothetical protein
MNSSPCCEAEVIELTYPKKKKNSLFDNFLKNGYYDGLMYGDFALWTAQQNKVVKVEPMLMTYTNPSRN